MSIPQYKDIDDLELQKWYTTPLLKKFIGVDGFTLPKLFLDHYEELRNFEVYDDDIWINTFPRSGTTLTQEMVWQIGNNLDFEGGIEKLTRRFPHLDLFMWDFHGCLESGDYKDLPVSEFQKDPINFVKNLKRPRYIKIHLPFNFFPRQILTGEKKPKIIYVSRNPKDVCVSGYHLLQTQTNLKATLEQHCKLFMEGRLTYSPHWRHVSEAWKHRNDDNVLMITYEEITKDLKSMIYKIAKFMNKSLTETQVEQLEDHLSFDNFRKNPAINRSPEHYKVHVALGIHRPGEFIRKGKTAGYKDELSSEFAKEFEQWEKDNAHKYPFKYNS